MSKLKIKNYKLKIKRTINYGFWGIVISLFLLKTVSAKFLDVDTTHPYFHAIDALQTANVVEGYKVENGRNFEPLKAINRAEALKILMLSAQIETLENDPKKFMDVPFSAWFSRYVNTAAEKGIVKGFQDGNFHPEAQVTRAEFLKMVIKSFDFEVPEQQSGEEWFDPFMRIGKEFRLISGNDLNPHEALNRGEVAEIIFRSQWVQAHKFKRKYTYAGSGIASYYHESFRDKKTANGEFYDPDALTAAHRTLPFGTRLKVWNDKGDVVFVRINDRGPYHKDRILDLSEKAFKNLAPLGQGVVDVFFEVYTDPVDDPNPIPENIRSSLSPEARALSLPPEIVKNLTPTIASEIDEEVLAQVTTRPEDYTPKRKTANKVDIKPLFKDGIKSLLPNFYDGVKLRRSIPQKVVRGTVVKFAGTVKKFNYKKATFFLENTKTQKQTHFQGEVSGNNFLIPVEFLDVGKFTLGLVFDRGTKSKIAQIEVVEMPKPLRRFPASKTKFLGKSFETAVKPEEKIISFKWTSDTERLTKITFSQTGKYKEVFIEDGMDYVNLPYEFFREFGTGENLAIDFYQAKTRDGTMNQQTTNWKKGPYDNFELTFGFPDLDDKKVGVPHFSRFVHKLNTVTIDGRIFDNKVGLSEHAYIIKADGNVDLLPIVRRGDQFQVRLSPKTWGTYVFEIVSDKGEVLFNRGMYFSPDQVLPIFPWKQTAIRTNTKEAVLEWLNVIRKRQKKSTLVLSQELGKLAQDYAENMADNNFISHTDQSGRDFPARVKAWGLQGEYGENLSYGSNFPLALEGLENSASHRKNLLESKWRKVGVGIAKNTNGDSYVVQIFGR